MQILIARYPFAFAALGMALLTGMDGLVKALSAGYPFYQIVFMRFLVTAMLIGAVASATRQPWPKRDRLKAHAGRALLMVVTTSSFFYALGQLPLAEVFALSFTSPIFTAIFASLLLREKVKPQIALAIGLGFCGMLVIVLADGAGSLGGLSNPPLALACALLSPITYALSIVLLRAQTAQESIAVIVAVQATMVAALLLPLVGAGMVLPGLRDGVLFLALGALGSAGYLAFASGLKHMSAARFSMVEYTGLIWAALLGYVFFNEVPRLPVWLGSALIIAGCLIVITSRTPPTLTAKSAAEPE